MKMSQKRLGRPSLGGLLATRQGSLTLAVLCAACAAGILMVALRQYKSHLRVTPPQATVLVATAEIRKGMTGQEVASEHLYKSTPVVASQVTPGAISDAGALAGEAASTDILPGQELTTTEFAAAAGVTGVLSPGQRAVAVNIDEAHGDSDVLQAGDHVDVYDKTQVGQILLDTDVVVIKPATQPAKAGGTTVTGASLVLAVDSKVVPEIQWANDNDKLYLALRPANAAKTPGEVVSEQSLIRSAVAAYGASTSSNPK